MGLRSAVPLRNAPATEREFNAFRTALDLTVAVRMDAENAHALVVKALEVMPLRPALVDDARLAVEAFGLAFGNPIGVAAGLDKDADRIAKGQAERSEEHTSELQSR